jgi:hypothetical protein
MKFYSAVVVTFVTSIPSFGCGYSGFYRKDSKKKKSSKPTNMKPSADYQDHYLVRRQKD